MSTNVAVFVLLLGLVACARPAATPGKATAGAHAAVPGMKHPPKQALSSVPIPFQFPGEKERHVPSTQFMFVQECFNFIYKSVSEVHGDPKKLPSFLTPLCEGGDKAQCDTWISSLVEAVEKKQADAAKKNNLRRGGYHAWCNKLYTDSAAGAPMHPVVARTTTTAAPAKRTTTKANKVAPDTKISPKVATTTAKPPGALKTAAERKHDVEKQVEEDAHVASSPKPVQTAKPTVAPARTLISSKNSTSNSTADGKDCACIHRHGRKLCHCFGDGARPTEVPPARASKKPVSPARDQAPSKKAAPSKMAAPAASKQKSLHERQLDAAFAPKPPKVLAHTAKASALQLRSGNTSSAMEEGEQEMNDNSATDVCIKDFAGDTPEAKCSAMVKQMQANFSSFLHKDFEGVDNHEACDDLNQRLQHLVDAKHRCQASTTCWEPMKKVLPTLLAKFKKAKQDSNCDSQKATTSALLLRSTNASSAEDEPIEQQIEDDSAADVCIKDFAGDTPTAKCSAMLKQMQANYSNFLHKDFEGIDNHDACVHLNQRLQDLVDAKHRCQASTTCYEPMKKMLPTLLLKFKKTKQDFHCESHQASALHLRSSNSSSSEMHFVNFTYEEEEEGRDDSATDTCIKGFAGATAADKCTAMLKSMQSNYTALTHRDFGNNDEICDYINRQIQDLEEAKVRCQYSKTCWERTKKMLPTMLEKFKKAKRDNNC